MISSRLRRIDRSRAVTRLVAFATCVAWAAGCSGVASDPETDDGASGGTTGNIGGTGATTGGASPLGGTSGTSPTGGAAPSGGTGAGLGGTAQGGAATGGVPTGGSAGSGAATGGTGMGGDAGIGGSTAGSGATAGSANGGSATGGTGGTSSGGAGGGGSAGKSTTGGTGGSGGKGGSGGGGSKGGVVGAPIGFATLNGGTTGGAAGPTVTVTTYADLKSQAESGSAVTILVQGTIANGADGGQINVKSNKSIVGVGNNAFLNGIGLNISSANNIIVQNLRISLIGVTTRTDKAGVYSSTGDEGMPQILVNGGDAIGIQGTSKNIWIDHCELFAENPDTQTNKDLFDGLVDVKGQTGFITISWNYLHDQHKGGLVGSSDTDLFADRKITYHHNYYNKVKLRVPMYRGAVGHFFNNYIVAATDASEIRAGTCVRIEKNYYEALHYSIYTSSDSAGSTERIDNVEVMRTSRAYPANCTADIPYSYMSALTGTTNDVKTVVPAGAGVGKL